jgi:DNA-directed RNA polymerase I subunit RPA12
MAAIGSLLFCVDCGDLLPPSKGSKKNILICECCGRENQDRPAPTIESRTQPRDFPSALRQKLQSSVKALDRNMVHDEATTEARCEKCGRTEVKYTELQLRGADEGSTIVYRCPCGHSWQENN